MRHRRDVDQLPRPALATEQALAELRVVGAVVGAALAGDEALQRHVAGVLHRVCEAAGAVADEGAGPDDGGLVADRDRGLAFQDPGALVLVVVHVELGRLVAGRHLDQMKAQVVEAGGVTERLVVALRVRVQEVDLVQARHRRDVFGGEDVSVHRRLTR